MGVRAAVKGTPNCEAAKSAFGIKQIQTYPWIFSLLLFHPNKAKQEHQWVPSITGQAVEHLSSNIHAIGKSILSIEVTIVKNAWRNCVRR